MATGVGETGLTELEASRLLEAGQGNQMPDGSSRSLQQILSANVFTLFNAIMLASAVILLLLGRWQDALFALPALLNTVIGVVQESSAKRVLDRLAVLNAPTARVRRDGVDHEIALEDVVLGDLLVLRSGDQVTADARVTQVAASGGGGLEVDESLLSGESEPVRKHPDDEVLSGSLIVAGSGLGQVIRVGADSYAAGLTAEARRFSLVHSELRSSIDRLLRWITWALAPVVLIVAYGQIRSHGGWDAAVASGAWRDALVGAVAAVVAMIPLGLVLMTSIAFAVSGVTLARRQVLVQELPAVEGLARVDVLCVDKTGTLTTGEIVFADAYPTGEVSGWRAVLGRMSEAPDANATARCLARPFGTGQALPVVDTIPFDSERKWSAMVIGGDSASSGNWVLGAPEFVLDGAHHISSRIALARAGELAASGLRTLVLARSSQAGDYGEQPVLPAGLLPAALLTFREQVRPDAADTLGYFADQGVEVLVISGDEPGTVAAVARQVGLRCGQGYDARDLPDDIDELGGVLGRERVFGRVTPTQKRSIVRALQHRGHVVAMTGDGVNDALAIKESDLGIAMDTAAQATKAVARLVLLDGRFERMPGVVAEGRRVIANIERVSKLFLTKTVYAVVIAMIFGVVAWSFPFLPRQLSVTNALTIGVPAFFLALMPNSARYHSGFLKRALLFSIPSGLIVASGLVALQIAASRLGAVTEMQLQSASVLVLAGIALWVLAVLARPFHPFRLFIVLAMYAGLGLAWAVPVVREFFLLDWLPQPLALLVAGIVTIGMVLVELLGVWHRRFTGIAG